MSDFSLIRSLINEYVIEFNYTNVDDLNDPVLNKDFSNPVINNDKTYILTSVKSDEDVKDGLIVYTSDNGEKLYMKNLGDLTTIIEESDKLNQDITDLFNSYFMQYNLKIIPFRFSYKSNVVLCYRICNIDYNKFTLSIPIINKFKLDSIKRYVNKTKELLDEAYREGRKLSVITILPGCNNIIEKCIYHYPLGSGDVYMVRNLVIETYAKDKSYVKILISMCKEVGILVDIEHVSWCKSQYLICQKKRC